MQFPIRALAFVLAAASAHADVQTAESTDPLTLAEVRRIAETVSPAVRSSEARLIGAEGARREAASFFFNNPELSADRTRRRAPAQDGIASEWGLGISQSFEIGGQQQRRREEAMASLESLRAEIEDARRQARAEASMRFQAVLSAQRSLQLEQRSVELFDSTLMAVTRRRRAGEDTRLDANVALIEAERAINALAVSRERLQGARAELAAVLQLPPSVLPDVIGELEVPSELALPYDLEQLLASARASPKLSALAARKNAARARVALEHASRYPDVTIGMRTGRDGLSDSRERTTTLSLAVPLPLFRRNEAAIGQALTEEAQAETDIAVVMRDRQAEVLQFWKRLDSQRLRVARLQRAMVAASTENRQLAAKSRQAGQIGLLDQLLINRQALDAERDLNEALAEFHTTRIELENAAGWSQEGIVR